MTLNIQKRIFPAMSIDNKSVGIAEGRGSIKLCAECGAKMARSLRVCPSCGESQA
jgi:hypothetical protein